ncbi:hypothetical protein J5N97_007205 [Dioscorea zingiberensis]|uniref:Uncharacterized protein n=1 Tax=Dioscorea zingiberensis TaxID=325984 RepID=A0A9D5HU05_9LILI|nr:hypothetical protein J5N97_007205 [Dioscorea zingiberensis]
MAPPPRDAIGELANARGRRATFRREAVLVLFRGTTRCGSTDLNVRGQVWSRVWEAIAVVLFHIDLLLPLKNRDMGTRFKSDLSKDCLAGFVRLLVGILESNSSGRVALASSQ